MQKESTYRNHYKTNPRTKNTIIIFHISTFYKTYESDAILLSQLFWFKVTIQDWFNSIWFSDTSQFYLDRLEYAGYGFVVLELEKNWTISVLRQYKWTKSLDMSVSTDIFQWLLDNILYIYERYNNIINITQSNERKNTWEKRIPFETFQWILDEISHINEKYSTTLRLIQPFDLPFLDNTPQRTEEIKDIYFRKSIVDDDIIKKLEEKNKPKEKALIE